MSSDPLVSILINNYNYGRFLDDSVTSALSQNYSNVEVIVVDDGSTDNSAEILKKYEGRANIIYKKNGGQASAFNAGFAASRGEIIFFLDSDDAYVESKVRTVVDVYTANPGIAYCFDKVVHTDAALVPLKAEQRPDVTHLADCRSAVRKGSLRKALVMQIPATSGLSFKRTFLESLFPIPESESCSMCENYMKYAAVGLEQGAFLETSLTMQRLHGKNLFTVENKDPSMGARISILTGYWLFKSFPLLARFADTQIALGRHLMKRCETLDARYHDLLNDYFKDRGFFGRLQIRSRMLLYALRG